VNPAKIGDTVQVHYVGRLDDGTEFDSSRDREPIEFTIGNHEVIPGFESAVVGMNPGETKTQKVPADQAYGPYRPERIFAIERTSFPPDIEPEPGLRLQVTDRMTGNAFPVSILRVSDDEVTLDANHPLAGKDLSFEITLVSIR
jgi:FKBP-type peptidyl-prolyl cis-trans isomerase 2